MNLESWHFIHFSYSNVAFYVDQQSLTHRQETYYIHVVNSVIVFLICPNRKINVIMRLSRSFTLHSLCIISILSHAQFFLYLRSKVVRRIIRSKMDANCRSGNNYVVRERNDECVFSISISVETYMTVNWTVRGRLPYNKFMNGNWHVCGNFESISKKCELFSSLILTFALFGF